MTAQVYVNMCQMCCVHWQDRDVAEGADFLMVKPGIAYLDVARMVKQKVSWDCMHVCLKDVGVGVVMVMCVLGGGSLVMCVGRRQGAGHGDVLSLIHI